MRWILVFLLVLAGCDNPSPHFRGVPATRVTVDGSVFDVRVRGKLAEAVRINAQYAPRFGPIRQRAEFAMAQVSGCKVKEVRGDQAVAIGILACKGRSTEWVAPARAPVSYSCEEVDKWISQGAGVEYTEFECDPY